MTDHKLASTSSAMSNWAIRHLSLVVRTSVRRVRGYTKVYWIASPLPPFCYVPTPKMISIVDDDDSVREGVSRLLSSAGFAVNAFASADSFLNSDQPARTDCFLLDLRMPGTNGIELERQFVADHSEVPIIFITAHGEEITAVQALDGRARTVLIKPFSEEALLNAINKALGIGDNS